MLGGGGSSGIHGDPHRGVGGVEESKGADGGGIDSESDEEP
jgi:hypothetical protein